MIATQQRGAVAPSVSRTPDTQPASEPARTSSRGQFARLVRLAQVVPGVIWLIDGALQFYGSLPANGCPLRHSRGCRRDGADHGRRC